MSIQEISVSERDAERRFLSRKEVFLTGDDLIVSKTDTRGIITYANENFLTIAGYTEEEVIGKPHSYVRHPEMPRCIFKLLWDTLKSEHELFAYVLNRCKNGDHYWVFSHTTPSYALDGKLIGYHSSRRAPKPSAIAIIEPLYKQLLQIEKDNGTKAGMDASFKALTDILAVKKITYEQFVFAL